MISWQVWWDNLSPEDFYIDSEKNFEDDDLCAYIWEDEDVC